MDVDSLLPGGPGWNCIRTDPVLILPLKLHKCSHSPALLKPELESNIWISLSLPCSAPARLLPSLILPEAGEGGAD